MMAMAIAVSSILVTDLHTTTAQHLHNSTTVHNNSEHASQYNISGDTVRNVTAHKSVLVSIYIYIYIFNVLMIIYI